MNGQEDSAANLLREREEILKRIQIHTKEITRKIGEDIRNLPQFHKLAEEMDQAAKSNQSYFSIYRPFLDFMKESNNRLLEIEEAIFFNVNEYHGSNQSLTSSAIATASNMAPSLLHNIPFPAAGPFVSKQKREEITIRLQPISPGLSQTYQAIPDIYYSSDKEGIRGALYQARQTLDHLLEALAPDNEVKESPFYVEKPEPNKGKVFRRERYLFACNKHIADRSKTKYFEARIDHLLSLYESLNEAHIRGVLNAEKLDPVLKLTDEFLDEWLNAMN